jgi:opacity protein-like surface antigen
MLRLGLSLVLVFAFAQTVFGESSNSTDDEDWQVSAFGGGSFLGDFQFPTPVFSKGQQSSQTVGIHYASGYQVGMRVTENVNKYWSGDLEYSFANQPVTFTNLSPNIQSLSLGQSVHHFSYNFSYIALPHLGRLQPYAKIGTGATLFHISNSFKREALQRELALRDSWKFLVNWGGGFQYLVYEPVSVTFDVKDNVTGVPSYGLPPSARIVDGHYRPGLSRNGLMNNWQINFGVTFRFEEYW